MQTSKELAMRTIVRLSLVVLAIGSTPTFAGEVTGNGDPIEINARSECAFSGLNDNDGDPRDPGGKTQSYGTLVGQFGLVDPSTQDPNGAFPPFHVIPGFACNPNRWTDLHAD
jgi:hypothetical protein